MFIFAWLIGSLAVGLFAERTMKRGGGSWFLLSLIFSPLLMFILVAALGPLHKEAVPNTANVTVKIDAYGDPVISQSNTSHAKPSDTYINTVRTAHELHLRKLLSYDEFARKRSEALMIFEAALINEDSMSILSKLVPLIDSGAIENYDIIRIKRKLGMDEVA